MSRPKTKSQRIKAKYTIGIDEVGRGPLAGPVVVAALALSRNLKFRMKHLELPLRDSKKLTPQQREMWFAYLKNHPRIFYATAIVSPKIIDKINISQSANLAANLALTKLIKNYRLKVKNCRAFLDGSLFIKRNILDASYELLATRTVVRGDEKIPAIMLASIVAKVTRDRIMCRLHKKYPEYGFDKHKGYGTAVHRKAIKKNGQSPVHRRSFRYEI